MPENAKDPLSFLQELKRRKVIRVIIVYAATAFVILELVSIVAEPFGLPDWTINLVFVLLFIGLIITIILSWIYDITPEGIEKTKPVQEIPHEHRPAASNGWKIASYVSFAVIAGLIVFHILSRSNRSDRMDGLDKSIAVLPFMNDSPDETKMYFINGTMEAILDNLCKIKELRVVSRTSVEQYRNNPKPIQQIAKEMDVSYVLEGSGLKDEDNIRLTIQLIDAVNDRHIWSDSYHRKSEEIFQLQSEIAQLVAGEIEAIISPEELHLIEKIPTTSQAAYDLYQKGREEYRKYGFGSPDREVLASVEMLYRQSLHHDSSFALAYLGLADICIVKSLRDPISLENVLDSALIHADKALSYDDQLADAYNLKGFYYRIKGDYDRAMEEWEKAIAINPNSAGAYHGMGWFYYSEGKYFQSIKNFHKAASLNRGPDLPGILRDMGFTFATAGFLKHARDRYREALQLDDDSVSYFGGIAWAEFTAGHFDQAIESGKMGIRKDSLNLNIYNILGSSYLYLGQFHASLQYFRKFNELLASKEQVNLYSLPWVAFSFRQNGYLADASAIANEQITLGREWIERKAAGWQENYMRLAMVYSFTGDKQQALENLRTFNLLGCMNGHVINLRKDPLFDNIKDEPEFQQIMDELEAKYRAEQERVRIWLEENDRL